MPLDDTQPNESIDQKSDVLHNSDCGSKDSTDISITSILWCNIDKGVGDARGWLINPDFIYQKKKT